jgi:hypothetical protein
MKLTKLLNRIVLPVLFVLYMLALFRIILFKYGSIDTDFLWDRLQNNLANPNPAYSMHRMLYGNCNQFSREYLGIHAVWNFYCIIV